MGVSLLDSGVVLHEEVHGLVVNFMRQDNVTRFLEGTVSTHGNEVLVELVDGFVSNTSLNISSPIESIQVPDDGGQVQLSSDPTDTIIQITKSLDV